MKFGGSFVGTPGLPSAKPGAQPQPQPTKPAGQLFTSEIRWITEAEGCEIGEHTHTFGDFDDLGSLRQAVRDWRQLLNYLYAHKWRELSVVTKTAVTDEKSGVVRWLQIDLESETVIGTINP